MMRLCFIIRKFRCTTYVVKLVVFSFNAMFLIFGVVLLTIGVSYRLRLDDYTDIFDSVNQNFSLIPNMIVICGAVVTTVAFIGTCGALTGSMCKLITYTIILLLLFIVQSAICAYLMIVTNYESEEHESDFKKMIYRRFLLILIRYNRNVMAQEWMDIMQQKFECCGIGHPCDWVILSNSTEVPDTCCKPGEPWCNQTNAFQRGCLLPIFDTIRENSDFFSGWLAFISMFEIVAAIVAICLTNMIRVDEIIYDYPCEHPVYIIP